MRDDKRDSEGVYIEAGETVSPSKTFSVDEVAGAFGVERDRVLRALDGEFALGSDARIDSKMAQQLVEVLLGDLPLAQHEAALMELGAFTPRRDATWGAGSGPADEESDRQSAVAGVPADDLPSERSSHGDATQSSR